MRKKYICEVFICYEETTGRAIAVHIKGALEKCNINAFVARMDIPKTDYWQNDINHYIKKCKCFVPILTTGVFYSSQVKREIDLAISSRRKILPCIYHELHNSEFLELWKMKPFDRLKENQAITFDNESNLANMLHSALIQIDFFKNKYAPSQLLGKIDDNVLPNKKYKSRHANISNASAVQTMNEFANEAKGKETFKELFNSHKDLNLGKDKKVKHTRHVEEGEKNA